MMGKITWFFIGICTVFALGATLVDSRRERHPVWSQALTQLTWDSGETDANSTTCQINGVIRGHITTVNNNTNNVTATVVLKYNSATMDTQSGIAENAATFSDTNDLWVNGTVTCTVTPSGDPGASGMTVDVVLYGD